MIRGAFITSKSPERMEQHRKRHRWLTLPSSYATGTSSCLVAVATSLAACGSTDLAQSRTAVPSSLPSLAECVSAWNAAVLGTGRQTIRAIALADDTALMARSSDGVCVLALPPGAGHTDGEGWYLTLLRGDYDLGTTPVNGVGSPHPPSGGEARMREPAATHTNVEVSARTGRIKAASGGLIPTLPYTILDRGLACKNIIYPDIHNQIVPDGYALIRSTATCGWVRSLIFAYEAREGSLLGRGQSGAPIRELAGWRCSGAGPFPARSVAQASRFRLRCVRGSQIVEAQGARGHVIGSR